MNFKEIAVNRQSCRNFDSGKCVEKEKIDNILEVARLSPSACNGQPYHITVCSGDVAKKVAKETTSMGMNKFTKDAPVMLVISEKPYVKTAALGAKVKGNDYRSIDIGILSAYITAAACEEGLSTCILGWLNSDKICEICSLEGAVRLVVALGYANTDDCLRSKKRKNLADMVTFMD